jgi:hypothetical protein
MTSSAVSYSEPRRFYLLVCIQTGKELKSLYTKDNNGG